MIRVCVDSGGGLRWEERRMVAFEENLPEFVTGDRLGNLAQNGVGAENPEDRHMARRVRCGVIGAGDFAEVCHAPGLQGHP